MTDDKRNLPARHQPATPSVQLKRGGGIITEAVRTHIARVMAEKYASAAEANTKLTRAITDNLAAQTDKEVALDRFDHVDEHIAADRYQRRRSFEMQRKADDNLERTLDLEAAELDNKIAEAKSRRDPPSMIKQHREAAAEARAHAARIRAETLAQAQITVADELAKAKTDEERAQVLKHARDAQSALSLSDMEAQEHEAAARLGPAESSTPPSRMMALAEALEFARGQKALTTNDINARLTPDEIAGVEYAVDALMNPNAR